MFNNLNLISRKRYDILGYCRAEQVDMFYDFKDFSCDEYFTRLKLCRSEDSRSRGNLIEIFKL